MNNLIGFIICAILVTIPNIRLVYLYAKEETE